MSWRKRALGLLLKARHFLTWRTRLSGRPLLLQRHTITLVVWIDRLWWHLRILQVRQAVTAPIVAHS